MSESQALLERAEELDLLAATLEAVEASGGRVVLIRGEAGVGKTSLVRGFLAACSGNVSVLSGACDDLLTPQPLAPFWDMAREEPSVAEPLMAGDRQLMLNAILDLFSRSLRPTILVVEDTQWADETTLDAIKYLGRRIDQSNGLLILTYRDEEVDDNHPLRAVIGGLPPPSVIRIRLQGLSVEAVAFMSEGAAVALDDLVALTDGNPLLVGELLASEEGGVPRSVQDSVLARAAKLGPEARSTLDLASVIPGEIDRGLIELLGATEDQLAECERIGLLRVTETTVAFHHELIRHAVESKLRPDDRRRFNAQVLEGLANRPEPASPARPVHHAREAGDGEAIVAYAPAAARAARKVNAHEDAIAHFEVLEPHLDLMSAADRAVVYEEWADSEDQLDRQANADRLIANAIDLYRAFGDDGALARTLLSGVLYSELRQDPDPDKSDQRMAEALEILEADSSHRELAKGVRQKAWLLMMRGEGEEAFDEADRAIRLARQTDDEASLIHALNTKGAVAIMEGDRRGFDLLEEARNRARSGGYLGEEMRALHNLGISALQQRALELAENAFRDGLERASKYQLSLAENALRTGLTAVLRYKGEWAAAEDLISETLADGVEGSWWAPALYWELGILETRRGRPQARSTLQKAWWPLVSPRDFPTKRLAAALTENMWLTGDVDEELIMRFSELLYGEAGRGNPWGVGELAFWLWKLGVISSAPNGIAEPYHLIFDGQPLEAARLWDELGYPYEKAIALSCGENESQLVAIDILETLGATAVAAKLRKDLRDRGVSIPRGKTRETREHPVGLTPRQAEVLDLLAEGLSNVEIADRLFLSPRTVEHHVAAVLSKLNVSSRDKAVTSAVEQGLLARR
jgi:DNA-binding CsgD family transcriptional regulator